MQVTSVPPRLRLYALLCSIFLLITQSRVSAQMPYTGYAILAEEGIDLRGVFEADSFDSSDPSASDLGQYSPLKRKGNAWIGTAGDLSFFRIGGAKIAGYVTTVNSSVLLDPDAAVGDLAYLEQGSTGIQEGYHLNTVPIDLPNVVVSFSSGMSPLQGVGILEEIITTNFSTQTLTQYNPPPNTVSVTTNYTSTTSPTYPQEGTYLGSVITNWYLVSGAPSAPSEPYRNLSFDTRSTSSTEYPSEGTYIGEVTTTTKGSLVLYHYQLITGYRYEKPIYAWNAFDNYSFLVQSIVTNVVVSTFDYVFDSGVYETSGLVGKVLVRGEALVHVTGDININGSGRLEIQEGASLKVYCSGDSVQIGGRGIINKTGNAAKCVLYGLPSNSMLRISAADTVIACIYAPQSEVVLATGATSPLDYIGFIVAGFFESVGSVRFHYDEALALNPGWPGAPVVTRQPASATVAPDQIHILSCGFTGSRPSSFQWWKDQAPLLANTASILHVNTPSLRLDSGDPGIAGEYFLVLSNSFGAVTSSVATITIGELPTIATLTEDRLVKVGDEFGLSVNANGTGPLRYQWLLQSAVLAGKTNAALAVSEATLSNAGRYQVVVGNDFGAITSGVSKVTAVSHPLPLSAAKLAGEDITFTADVSTLEGLTFQWHHNNQPISGATGSALALQNVQPQQIGTYSVFVSNSIEGVMSAPTSLSVDGAPRILVQPLDQLVNYGETVSLSVSATGANGLQFQWMHGTQNLPGATNASLELPAATLSTAGTYSVSIWNDYGSVTSQAITVSVQLDAPQIVLEPQDQSVPIGSNVVFTTAATSPAPLTYQWQRNGVALSGKTDATLELPDVQYLQGGNYRCLVRNEAGSIFTRTAILSVQLPPVPILNEAGVYNGLFAQPGNLTHDTAGFFTMKVRTNGRYSGKFLLDGDALSKSGTVSSNGQIVATLSRSKLGKPSVVIQLQLDFAGSVFGTVSSSNWQSELRAFEAIITTNTVPEVDGRYTFLLPRMEEIPDAPKGTGYSLLNVRRAKIVSAGYLPDGSPLKQSVHYTTNGYWPYYARHYLATNFIVNSLGVVKSYKNYKGSTIGWLTFTNQMPVGTLHWQMPTAASAHYPAGLTNSTDIIGSSYVRPLVGRIINLTNGVLSLSGGLLTEDFANSFILKTNNTVQFTSTNKPTRLAFSQSTGAFSGNYVDGEERVVFRGAMLQNRNFGAGYFSPTNGSGNVTVESVD